nr:u3 small nucleolar rna-associated protein 20 [Quercus suber]
MVIEKNLMICRFDLSKGMASWLVTGGAQAEALLMNSAVLRDVGVVACQSGSHSALDLKFSARHACSDGLRLEILCRKLHLPFRPPSLGEIVTMAPGFQVRGSKPSEIVNPKRDKKRSTPHSRNHRFQGFNERVAKIRIDPIKRRRNANELVELEKKAATYLGRALEEWRDLNLSQNFTLFVRDVSPLCDSLPVVLHNEDKIMDLLIAYIQKSDSLSMEPLLALMSQFAHDLDIRFERHFERAVATITAVAAQHADPAVVEWSFTCLAWLFKYLSRLLAADLRPLYDLMSPYMGKQPHKPFVVRFAAESLSFLLRKTAAMYERDQAPLDNVIDHMFRDVLESAQSQRSNVHSQGVMTLLTEAVKGVKNGIHSSGIAIIKSVLKIANNGGRFYELVLSEVVCGSLVSIIHHTNAVSFEPILDTIVEDYITQNLGTKSIDVRLAAEVLLTVASVRKGTRIAHWKPIIATMNDLVLHAEQDINMSASTASGLMKVVAVVLQSTTIDMIMPALNLIENFRKAPWTTYFLRFCDIFARLGHERFQNFVLPHFQKFVTEQWNVYGEKACFLLPNLSSKTTIVQISLPVSTQNQVLDDLHSRLDWKIVMDASGSRYASAYAILSAVPHLKWGEEQLARLRTLLHQVITHSIESDPVKDAEYCVLGVGVCLGLLLNITNSQKLLDCLWVPLCSVSSHWLTHTSFWSNVRRYMEICPPANFDNTSQGVLETALLQSLALPSHDIRESALAIIHKVYTLQGTTIPDAFAAAITIESTPVKLDTARSISMNIRRLASGYAEAINDDFMKRAIPSYCFGILQFQLAQAWEDVVVALSEICKSPAGEEVVITLAQSWMDGAPDIREHHLSRQPVFDVESEGFNIGSDFECSNLARVCAIANQVFESPLSGYQSSEERFSEISKHTPTINDKSRSQALRVFSKMPHVAEKRSRMLVPVLLKWAGANDKGDSDEPNGEDQYPWSRKDQKAMLGIVACFNNPKVLFRTSEVHDALMNLCANGDLEIQESALKAIFAWKEPSINDYQEHLLNLLDEARFRDEISIFLQGADEEQVVRREHQTKLMPVLLRLLYGRAVAGGKHGQASRRKAIFVALSRFGPKTIGLFVDIATSKLSESKSKQYDGHGQRNLLSLPMPLRQQLGMLNMLNELLDTLGGEMETFGHKVLDAALTCSVSASMRIDKDAGEDDIKDSSLLRSVRQTGMQCLFKVFNCLKNSDFSEQATVIMQKLVAPRLDKFALENTQSISAMLRLFAAWSAEPKTASYLSDLEPKLLDHIADLLSHPNAKDEVRVYVLQNILDNLAHGKAESLILQPHVSNFISSIGVVLATQPAKDVLDACVNSFTQLASLIRESQEAESVVAVCVDLLVKPSKVVAPWTKTGLLKTLLTLVDRFQIKWNDSLFSAICGLFSRSTDTKSRTIASEVFLKLSKDDASYKEVALICAKMNAQSTRSKLDEPDHQQREQGFTQVYQKSDSFTFSQWLPVVHNCLFFVRDADDLVNRSSAAQALELFVKSSSTHGSKVANVLLPAIERGFQDSSELVRAEYLRLLGRIVETCPEAAGLDDLVRLTVGGDDEASVFANILHIQQHRRLRALRRLSDEAHIVSSTSTSMYFLPLLEHFVFDQADGDAGRTLADQTIVTIGALTENLSWSAFRVTFKRYIGYIKSKEDLEKTTFRLLGVLVDALGKRSKTQAQHATVPNATNANIIIRDFLPSLTAYIHQKDESTVDRRMPVAVTIVKLLLLLPENELAARLPPVLTDISHVLRSRSQEARDQTRKTLAAIMGLIGPTYLGFMLKELRSALQRGYQLHVLSFTVHSLLVLLVDVCQPGDLNHCLHDLTAIVMDDIFGVTGQEKDSEEYKSTMKEVKGSKSYDTMELLAKVTPITRLGQLIQPLRALLSERLDAKSVRKIDDLLIRLRKGIDLNPAADSRDMLIFCHEVVRQVYVEQAAPSSKTIVQDYKVKKYLITMDMANKSESKSVTTSQMFKLVSFALNLVRKVVRRHEDLLTPANMVGFLPMTGDALLQGQEEVKLSAMRLLATIIRVPIPDLDLSAQVYVKEAVATIKASTSTTTDSAKAALELITAIVREKRSVTIKDSDVALLLKTIKSDVDEPDRQNAIYKFIRAVLGRNIVITEVYEIMDEVGRVMVTNADRGVRESARGAYLRFIMDYPQGKDRWNKQARFLVENLRYEHSTGRQSVMELLHQLLPKIGDDVMTQLGFTIFVALVPVQVSDADNACRQMAGLLVAKLFDRAANDQLQNYRRLMDSWMNNDKKPVIQIASLECWKLYLRTRDDMPERQRRDLLDSISKLLSDRDMADDQLLQHVLETFAVMVDVMPEIAFAALSSDIWENIQQCLAVSNANVQETASKLYGTYLSHLASHSAKSESGLSAIPMRGSGGLELSGDGMRKVCRMSLRVFMTTDRNLSETLAAQTIRNLGFLGRCFATNDLSWQNNHQTTGEVEDKPEAVGEETSEEDDLASAEKKSFTALSYLLNRLSYIVRQEVYSASARTSALKAQQVIISALSRTSFEDSLSTILRPLYALTDPSIPQPAGEAHKVLIDHAQETMELLQKKIGAEAYMKVLGEVRKGIQDTRQERRRKRRIEAVAAPERWAKQKKRRHELQRTTTKSAARDGVVENRLPVSTRYSALIYVQK